MNTGLLIGLGLAAAAAYAISRGNATRSVTVTLPSGATFTTQAPNVPTSAISNAIAQQREAMIQRIMTNDHLSRADAEARYNQLMPSVTAALLPTSGLGNYYRA